MNVFTSIETHLVRALLLMSSWHAKVGFLKTVMSREQTHLTNSRPSFVVLSLTGKSSLIIFGYEFDPSKGFKRGSYPFLFCKPTITQKFLCVYCFTYCYGWVAMDSIIYKISKKRMPKPFQSETHFFYGAPLT